jgi:hypothetical protein
MPRCRLGLISMVALAALLSACQEPSKTTSDPLEPSLATDAWCAANPGKCSPNPSEPDEPSDPSPSSPGYWTGSTITWSTCVSPTGAGISDGDHDALSDYCEDFLAQRFRPLLVVSPHDCDIGMEPYWAAKAFPNKKTVRVAYLFSYYKDCGPQSFPSSCNAVQIATTFVTALTKTFGITIHDPCDGHQGDSEFVTVDLQYNATTQHWYVTSAYFSAHWMEALFDRSRRAGYGQLEYPEKPQGYFRAYVAEGKHANYPARAVCEDDGGPADTCQPNSSTIRIRHANQYNVGSSRYNFINPGTCVRGGALFTAYPENYGTECFWKDQSPYNKFRGWSKYVLANDANSYLPVLTLQFECYSYARTVDSSGNSSITCSDWGVNT